MVLQIYTDGGSKGNPGPAAIGIAFFLDGNKIDTYREDIGKATNNEAEYRALIKALEWVRDSLRQNFSGTKLASLKQLIPQHSNASPFEKIACFSDSRLMVNQVNGIFKVKESRIREFIFKIRTLEQEIGLPITYIHIPREKNQIADNLVNNKD